MPKKIKLSENIAKSLSVISIASKSVRKKLTLNSKVIRKRVFTSTKPSLFSNLKKFINHPVVKTIGLNILTSNKKSSFSIYNHNICWTQSKANHTRIAKKMQTLQPDIICLQEIVFQTQFKIFNLANYHRSIAPGSGKRVVRGGLAIYSKKMPLCVNFVKFIDQGKIFSPQLAERRLEKGFLVAEFSDYLIINTHLVADQTKKWTELKLKHTNAQFEQLLNFIKETGDAKPIFIAGDLNFCPTNDSYQNATQLDLVDLTSKIPYTYIDKEVKLDYIWTTKSNTEFKTRLVRFNYKEPSDHLAIYSQILI